MGDRAMVPRYEHDCKTCIYLGEFEEYDLYACQLDKPDRRGTVVARWSSEAHEYKSGLVFAEKGLIPELVEALKRWNARAKT